MALKSHLPVGPLYVPLNMGLTVMVLELQPHGVVAGRLCGCTEAFISRI